MHIEQVEAVGLLHVCRGRVRCSPHILNPGTYRRRPGRHRVGLLSPWLGYGLTHFMAYIR